MITVSVKDDSDKTTFTHFNKEVERLLGISIDHLVADIGQTNLTQDLPHVLNNILQAPLSVCFCNYQERFFVIPLRATPTVLAIFNFIKLSSSKGSNHLPPNSHLPPNYR
ncbi:hypothetical protein POM88_010717 [Heracleum sosnowskyi]|uniref:Uncharacterized protein n=1 Tax=Heracleum sosnowskyi TaxID=360622 RepID=A0AAD8IVN0_9APIA|nr:hypothetical protein POM88_010717 [Heracleum sosnowskyi]